MRIAIGFFPTVPEKADNRVEFDCDQIVFPEALPETRSDSRLPPFALPESA
jgi:hypothetical protein